MAQPYYVDISCSKVSVPLQILPCSWRSSCCLQDMTLQATHIILDGPNSFLRYQSSQQTAAHTVSIVLEAAGDMKLGKLQPR